MATSLNLCKPFFHSSHSERKCSGIRSSHPIPLRHSSCRMRLPLKVKGAMNPSGSNRDATTDKRPWRVGGWSFASMLKLKVSFSDDHRMPSMCPCPSVAASGLKLGGSVVTALSEEATQERTSLWFELNLCRRRPALFQSSCASTISSLASLTVGTLVSPSST